MRRAASMRISHVAAVRLIASVFGQQKAGKKVRKIKQASSEAEAAALAKQYYCELTGKSPNEYATVGCLQYMNAKSLFCRTMYLYDCQ